MTPSTGWAYRGVHVVHCSMDVMGSFHQARGCLHALRYEGGFLTYYVCTVDARVSCSQHEVYERANTTWIAPV
jgi:hypothetical protein